MLAKISAAHDFTFYDFTFYGEYLLLKQNRLCSEFVRESKKQVDEFRKL